MSPAETGRYEGEELSAAAATTAMATSPTRASPDPEPAAARTARAISDGCQAVRPDLAFHDPSARDNDTSGRGRLEQRWARRYRVPLGSCPCIVSAAGGARLLGV